MTTVPAAAQTELLRAYHERGDLHAREQLVEEYLPLVRSIARRYAGRGEQLEDLVQVGSIGLIKAIDRFDLSRNVDLRTYAIPTIVGEIRRHFRDHGWALHVPRRLKELNVRLSTLMDDLNGRLGRSPTVAELAEAAGVEEEEVIDALEAAQAYSVDSLSAPPSDGSELERMHLIGEDEPAYETAEDRGVLAPGLAALDERERRILHLRFVEGLTQSQIAREIGISQMHVSRLIRRALDKMREQIEAPE